MICSDTIKLNVKGSLYEYDLRNHKFKETRLTKVLLAPDKNILNSWLVSFDTDTYKTDLSSLQDSLVESTLSGEDTSIGTEIKDFALFEIKSNFQIKFVP